jgi:hypothetical protein
MGWNAAVHSEYWNTGNASLANMGRIIAGKLTMRLADRKA